MTSQSRTIEINDQFKHALELLENTSSNLFITGKAGTGKSTLLEYFRSTTSKEIAVLAPKGVAAINVKGETIHSFFGFKPDITTDKIKRIKSEKKKSIYKKLDTIIIDEISMARADIIDCIDKFLRLNGKNSKKVFGGIQMVFIGDLYQLPPVVVSQERELFGSHYKSSYFFDSFAFLESNMEFIELEKIYRQKDESFIRLLNAVRNNSVTDKDLEMLNKRIMPEDYNEPLDYYIYLTSTNKTAAHINLYRLSAIDSKEYSYQSVIEGDFQKNAYPTDEVLRLKAGAQVMLLNNDSMGRWVNGTIGTIAEISREEDGPDMIFVKLDNGEICPIEPYKWDIFHFKFNPEAKKITAESAGSFAQYPIKLAWAITIHKSQGKTFDKVVLDISGGVFACGQIYVALSRCRTLEGIYLTQPISKKHVFTDWKISDFLTKFQYEISEKIMPLEEKMDVIQKAIDKNQSLNITYLKPNDEKSVRKITPLRIGAMEYKGREFLGLEAYCHKREETRTFKIDRILQLGS